MPRLIINYPDDMDALTALSHVRWVVSQGLISKSGDVPHYCWATVSDKESIAVYTRRKKPGQKSDSLLVVRTDK